MPVPEGFFEIRVKPSEGYNHYAWITLSEEKGIKAFVGFRNKGQDILAYAFDEKKWSRKKAKAWFEEHREGLKVKEHVTVILPFKVLEKIVDKPLKIRGVAITAGMSRNFNLYAPEELQAFTQKFVSAPVYIEHVAVPNAVGKVTKTEWDGSNLWYEAEIYDDETVEKIRKGLIQHVSVGADYETLDVLDGQIPHGLHNAELSLVAVPGIPETNVQILERLRDVRRIEQVEPIVAGEYVLGFYQDAAAFLPEHFRTVWLDKENGILAVIGKLREQPETERVHAIFFAKEKMWDQTKIKDWLSLHPDYMAPAGVGSAAPLKERETMSEQNQNQEVEIKPKEGESHEDFMKRCLAAGREMERCANIWKQAHPEGETRGQAQERRLTEAEWDTEYINNLPDDAFAYIEPSGEKDEEDKTKPRSLRHLPFRNAQGNIDHDHLANALARLPQTDLSAEAKAAAKKKLCAAVKTWNGEHPDNQITSDVCGVEPKTEEQVQNDLQNTVSELEAKVSDLLARVEKLEKGGGAGNVAEGLLKKSAAPSIPLKEAIRILERLLPSPVVERSSMGMQRECQEIRRAIFQLKEMLKSG